MPFPTTTALPLLSGDMRACARVTHTHTHTHTHTPQVKGHLSAPSVPHEEEPSIRQHFEKANRQSREGIPSVTKVCYSQTDTAKRNARKRRLREPGLSQLIQTPTQTILESLSETLRHRISQEYSYLLDAYYTSDTVLGVSVCKRACVLSCVWLFVTLWAVAHQAPLSMRLSRQEYWSGLPCPRPGDLPNPGIEPGSPALQEDSLPLSH